jgi:hypothetical protein
LLWTTVREQIPAMEKSGFEQSLSGFICNYYLSEFAQPAQISFAICHLPSSVAALPRCVHLWLN